MDPLVEFILEEPADQVEQLAAALETGSIPLTAMRSRLRLAFTHGPRSLERMQAVLGLWRE